MASYASLKRAEDVLGVHLMRTSAENCTSAMLEIADRCNETCAHCYQEQGQKGELSTAQWKGIIDDLADLGVLLLTFSGGEATLRSDFVELVEHARHKGFLVKIYSNGLHIDEAMAARLAELAVHEVQISVYSHRAEVHDWITGVPGSHVRTLQSIRRLRAAGIAVLMKSPIFSVNADEIDAWLALASELGAHHMLDTHVKARETGARDPQGLAPSAEQLARALAKFKSPGRAVPDGEGDLDRPPCGACRIMTVEANGEVRPCGALTVPLGNATEEGVVAAYRESDTATFVRSLTWRDLAGCRDCDLMPNCARCYSDARFEGGDALLPYASACKKTLTAREQRLGRPVQVSGVNTEPPLGPFKLLAEDHVESFEAELTERDHALRERQPWIRFGVEAPVQSALETQLVQIRRPGRKQPIGGTLPLSPKR